MREKEARSVGFIFEFDNRNSKSNKQQTIVRTVMGPVSPLPRNLEKHATQTYMAVENEKLSSM